MLVNIFLLCVFLSVNLPLYCLNFMKKQKIEVKKIKLIILLDSSAIVRSKIKRKVALALITLEKVFVKEIFRLKEPG